MGTQTAELTIADIEAGYHNDGWLGFGYLGERARYAERDDRDEGREVEADLLVLEHANERRWSRDELFAWLNSRDGRRFGDTAFGGFDSDVLQRQAPWFFRGWEETDSDHEARMVAEGDAIAARWYDEHE